MSRLLWCDYCNEQGNAVSSERDRLKAEREEYVGLFNEWKMKGAKWTQEIEFEKTAYEDLKKDRDRWKAELEKSEKVRWELVNQRDKFEALAGKMAEALRRLSECSKSCGNTMECECGASTAKEALAAYEEGMKK